MAEVCRLVGGAGTGKTTSLMELIEKLVERLGSVGDIGFATFSRAARAEAVTRACAAFGYDEGDLARDGWFRTLHSACYRIAEARSSSLIVGDTKEGQKWLEGRIGVALKTVLDDETGANTFIGESVEARALNLWDYARNTLQPLQQVCEEAGEIYPDTPWYEDVRAVVEKYESAKRLGGRIDFADLVMQVGGVGASPSSGFYDIPPVGEVPEVAAWLIDEAQDLSPLTAKVVDRLAASPSCRWLYLVGDPFQSIYGFAGASPRPFMDWQVAKSRVMPRSYRCPKIISDLGERILSGCSDYWERGIEPAGHDGSIEEADIGDLTSIVSPGEDWMLIARANYIVGRIRRMLDDADLPHRSTKSDSMSQATRGKRALYLLEQGKSVDPADFGCALQLVPSQGLLEWGAKSNYDPTAYESIHLATLRAAGCKEEFQTAVFTGEWARLVDGGEKFRDWAERWGLEAAAAPRIRVGTIHSVKGAEADNVLVVNSSCQRFAVGAAASESRADEERRLGYVAVTRARRRLIVASDPQCDIVMPGL